MRWRWCKSNGESGHTRVRYRGYARSWPATHTCRFATRRSPPEYWSSGRLHLFDALLTIYPKTLAPRLAGKDDKVPFLGEYSVRVSYQAEVYLRSLMPHHTDV